MAISPRSCAMSETTDRHPARHRPKLWAWHLAGSYTLYLNAARLGEDGAQRIARTLTLAEPFADASTW